MTLEEQSMIILEFAKYIFASDGGIFAALVVALFFFLTAGLAIIICLKFACRNYKRELQYFRAELEKERKDTRELRNRVKELEREINSLISQRNLV